MESPLSGNVLSTCMYIKVVHCFNRCKLVTEKKCNIWKKAKEFKKVNIHDLSMYLWLHIDDSVVIYLCICGCMSMYVSYGYCPCIYGYLSMYLWLHIHVSVVIYLCICGYMSKYVSMVTVHVSMVTCPCICG